MARKLLSFFDEFYSNNVTAPLYLSLRPDYSQLFYAKRKFKDGIVEFTIFHNCGRIIPRD